MESPGAAVQPEESSLHLALQVNSQLQWNRQPCATNRELDGGTPDQTSNGRKRRGRKAVQTPEERAEKKRLNDRNLRQENRDVILGLKEVAPILRELLQWAREFKQSQDFIPAVMQSGPEITNDQDQATQTNQHSPLYQPEPDENGQENITRASHQHELGNNDDEFLNYMDTLLPAAENECIYGFNESISSQCGLTSANEELLPNPNNEPLTQGSPGSSQSGKLSFDDEEVENFLKQFDSNCKRQVNYSDFNGLIEELSKGDVGYNDLPPCLIPTAGMIKNVRGDITKSSKQSKCAANPTYIMFCAALKEMHELSLKDLDETRLKVWGEAINNALNIDFDAGFAKEHLRKIVHAYFGLKAKADRGTDPELQRLDEEIRELEAKTDALRKLRQQKLLDKNSDKRKECLHQAEYFNDKPLSTGLLN